MSEYSITNGTPAGMPSGPRASVGLRFVALVIDIVVVAVVEVVVTLLLRDAVAVLLAVVVGLGYYVYFEGRPAGQTIGKKIVDIRVIDFETGGPVDTSRAIIRTLVRIPGAVACFAGYVWALFNKENQTWHDLAARTVVVPTSAYPVS